MITVAGVTYSTERVRSEALAAAAHAGRVERGEDHWSTVDDFTCSDPSEAARETSAAYARQWAEYLEQSETDDFVRASMDGARRDRMATR